MITIYENIKACPDFKNATVTVGFFDGVHQGHQRILARLKEVGEKNKGETVLITFWPHPKSVLQPPIRPPIQLLNTFEEKVKLLAKRQLQNVIKIPFTKQFAAMSSQDFIRTILVERIKTKTLIIGHDHRFGKNKQGNIEELRKYGTQYGFKIEQVPKQEVDNIGAGSSKIRKALLSGYPELATRLLGQPYFITGKVIEGDQLGRKIGFPTANLAIPSPDKLIPKEGTYAATIQHQKKNYGGMLYIGTRPTLPGKRQQSVEINIFDFDKNIYGEEVSVNLISLIREDVCFDTLESLRTQIELDKKSSTALLKKKKLI